MQEVNDELIERAFGKDRDALPKQSGVIDPNSFAHIKVETGSSLSGSANIAWHGALIKSLLTLASLSLITIVAYVFWPSSEQGGQGIQQPVEQNLGTSAQIPVAGSKAEHPSSHALRKSDTETRYPTQLKPMPPSSQHPNAAVQTNGHDLLLPKGDPITYVNPDASLKLRAEDSTEKNKRHDDY